MKRLIVVIGSLAALAAPISPQAATTVSRETLDQTFFCNGDPVHVTGTLLVTESATTTPSGGQVVAFHFSGLVTGTDLVTGTVFRTPGIQRDLTVNPPPGGSTETFVQRISLVSPTDVFAFSDLIHVTVTPERAVRVSFDNFAADC